jgi:hypothetical protein
MALVRCQHPDCFIELCSYFSLEIPRDRAYMFVSLASSNDLHVFAEMLLSPIYIADD